MTKHEFGITYGWGGDAQELSPGTYLRVQYKRDTGTYNELCMLIERNVRGGEYFLVDVTSGRIIGSQPLNNRYFSTISEAIKLNSMDKVINMTALKNGDEVTIYIRDNG